MKQAFLDSIETVTFSSLNKGPKLLVLGSVHGNETCGSVAIRSVIAKLQSGQVALQKGSVTFVPVCNPKAQAAGVRFVDKNLNRVICAHEDPQAYEEKIAGQITPLIDACDWVLDIHSYHTQGPAFVFQDSPDPEIAAFTRCLGASHIVSGWPEMYAAPDAEALMEGDTIGYAVTHGKKGAVIECGHHDDPAAIGVAEDAIWNALDFLDIALGLGSDEAEIETLVRSTHIVVKAKEGKLVKAWHHMDSVSLGEVIAVYADGTQEVSCVDGVLLLPKGDALIGEEWFYYGVQAEEMDGAA